MGGKSNMVVKVAALLLLIGVATTVEGRSDVKSVVAQVIHGGEYSSLQYLTSSVPCCASCECTKSDPPQCHCQGFTLRTHVCEAVCPQYCACNRIAEPYTRCYCGASLPFCFPLCPRNGDHFIPNA